MVEDLGACKDFFPCLGIDAIVQRQKQSAFVKGSESSSINTAKAVTMGSWAMPLNVVSFLSNACKAEKTLKTSKQV